MKDLHSMLLTKSQYTNQIHIQSETSAKFSQQSSILHQNIKLSANNLQLFILFVELLKECNKNSRWHTNI